MLGLWVVFLVFFLCVRVIVHNRLRLETGLNRVSDKNILKSIFRKKGIENVVSFSFVLFCSVVVGFSHILSLV